MSRQSIIKQLEKKNKEREYKVDINDKQFFETLQTKFDEFAELFGEGVTLKNLEQIVQDLEQLEQLKPTLEALSESLKSIPNEIGISDLNSLLKALNDAKSNKVELFGADKVKAITDRLNDVIEAVKDNTVPKQGQDPSDFVPMRRVMKVADKLMFDDSFYTGGGSGGNNVPTVNGGVPVVNLDGTPIAGGSSGGDVNITEVNGSPFSLGQKGQAASLPITNSTDTLRIDQVSSTLTYIGSAIAGSATSAAVWQVKKIDSSSGTSILFADGDIGYDNVWDDRGSLSYS